jgi:hypothetical protein
MNNQQKESIMFYTQGTYLAFKLAQRSRVDLLQRFEPQYSRVVCDHITIAFELNQPSLDTILEAIGDHPKFDVFGYSDDGSLECLSVCVDTPERYSEIYRPNGGIYHITHSLKPHRKPVESGKLLETLHGVPMIKNKKIQVYGELVLLPK